jgi:hypothetical protein
MGVRNRRFAPDSANSLQHPANISQPMRRANAFSAGRLILIGSELEQVNGQGVKPPDCKLFYKKLPARRFAPAVLAASWAALAETGLQYSLPPHPTRR